MIYNNISELIQQSVKGNLKNQNLREDVEDYLYTANYNPMDFDILVTMIITEIQRIKEGLK